MPVTAVRLCLTTALIGLVATSVACAGGAPAPVGPTAQAAATAVATAASPAIAAASPAATAASPAVATAAVVASPAAATAVAAASPVVAAASPAIATAAATSPVRITGINLSPTDTTITVQNASGSTADLGGWRLQVGTASATLPSAARVNTNESITIHTASGTNTARDIYLGQDAATLASGLRPGARVALVNAQGQTVNEFTLPG